MWIITGKGFFFFFYKASHFFPLVANINVVLTSRSTFFCHMPKAKQCTAGVTVNVPWPCTQVHTEALFLLPNCNTSQGSDHIRLGEQLTWRIHSCANTDCRCLHLLGNEPACSPITPEKKKRTRSGLTNDTVLWDWTAPLLPGHRGLWDWSINRGWREQMGIVIPERTKPRVPSPAHMAGGHRILSSWKAEAKHLMNGWKCSHSHLRERWVAEVSLQVSYARRVHTLLFLLVEQHTRCARAGSRVSWCLPWLCCHQKKVSCLQ